jgi:low temperature requirement protein LtrA
VSNYVIDTEHRVYGFIGPGLGSLSGWRVQPAHFAERHGLIIIIAIGESLAAIGFGARGTSLGGSVIVAVVLGVLVAAAFWLAYFDFFSITGQQLLTERQGPQRIALARDLYTYLHLPMVAGIVLFAYGTKVTVAHVQAELHSPAAFALCGGSAIYLLAYVALRWRVSRRLRSGRLIASAGFALLVPVAVFVPALVTLALVTAVWFGLHAYELIWWREERARRRAGAPVAV